MSTLITYNDHDLAKAIETNGQVLVSLKPIPDYDSISLIIYRYENSIYGVMKSGKNQDISSVWKMAEDELPKYLNSPFRIKEL